MNHDPSLGAGEQCTAAQILARSEVFGWLGEAIRDRLLHVMADTTVPSGHVALRQGEESEVLFIVVSGVFEVRLRRGNDAEAVIDTIGPGETFGEIQVVVGGVSTATVVAVSAGRILRLSHRDFDVLCEESPELLETVARLARRRLQRQQLLEVLPALLGPLDGGVLAAIERQGSWVSLRRGEVLFRRGDPGDAWYVVTGGRLAVVEPAVDDCPEYLLAEVERGEALGELALLTGESRSATVYALRDSELVRFSMDDFSRLLAAVPQVLDAVLRTLARRLMRRAGPPDRRQVAGRTMALVPATRHVQVGIFADRLTKALSRFGPTLQLRSDHLSGIGVGHEMRLRPDSHPAWTRVAAWLEAQAVAHRFLLLVAEAEPSGWSRYVVGQADQVIVVADADGDPLPSSLEEHLLPPDTALQARRLLALLHRDGSHPPRGTARWLDARAVDEHVHIRMDRTDDVERLARSIAGRGVSLVLSGGGARCFAQLGVVRAMREQGVPIDLVAGTSAGAMSAFLVAAGCSDDAMRGAAALFHRARPMDGYTLPLFSLKGGERLSRALRNQCGDVQIEDLWIPFVAVSSNLTRRSVQLHTRGPAWAALRASGSVPGVVDPFVQDGELLVDGVLIDNLPVRVARERLPGRVIAVDVAASQPLTHMTGDFPSPWREALGRLVRSRDRHRRRNAPPGLLDVLLHSMLLASLATVEQMRLDADLCLRPELAEFGTQASAMYERIIEAGYLHARERLTTFTPADDGQW
ncbi:MAG: cyclic nucleotide-binding domain-containing protein [Dermatophilaceae bacterium]